MGMLGGLQVLRTHNCNQTFEDPNLSQNLLHTILPWRCSSIKHCTIKEKEKTLLNENADTKKTWRKRVDFNAFLHVGFVCGTFTTRLLLGIIYPEDSIAASLASNMVYLHSVNSFFQFFAVHSQLTIIIGLCMDDGDSLTSKFLRTRCLVFLGRISLSLYLLHFPIGNYIALALNKLDWQNIGALYLPFWLPFIKIIISPFIAFVATKYFEEPLANILKRSK